MPRYDYSCSRCGVFSDWAAMDRCSVPTRCPCCGTLSRRILSAFFLADMDRGDRIAHRRNELAAHEPRVMTREQLDLDSSRPVHADGAPADRRGDHSHSHGPDRPHRPHRHPGRPWVIGH